jgi:hypothetical protein
MAPPGYRYACSLRCPADLGPRAPGPSFNPLEELALTDVTEEFHQLMKKQRAIRTELERCQAAMDGGEEEAARVARAEKEALEAELEVLQASFEALITEKAVAESSASFARRPAVPKDEDWQEFILHASSDYDDYLAWHQEIQNIRYPRQVADAIESRRRRVRVAEELWLQKIAIWERAQARHEAGR